MPRTEPNKQKLTALAVTKLRPTTRPYLVWDTLQRGLALQVQPSGYRAYKLIYRFHNRPRWFHIGPADAISLADARKLAAKLMLQVIEGKDPAAEKRAARGTGTFAEIANRYVEEYAKKKNKSWQQADALVRRHLLPAWGLPDRAVNSAIFSWAMRQDLLPHNPCRGVERNATASRERVLSDTELPLLWHAFTNAGLPGTALQVLLLTGQRPGEVSHMRQDQIIDGWWTLPGAPDASTGWPGTKNGATHRLWLPQPVRDIIAAFDYVDDTGFVFGQY